MFVVCCDLKTFKGVFSNMVALLCKVHISTAASRKAVCKACYEAVCKVGKVV